MSVRHFNNRSFGENLGRVSGYLVGRVLADPVSGMAAFAKLAFNAPGAFLDLAVAAVKAKVIVAERRETIAYARDAAELAAERLEMKKGGGIAAAFRKAKQAGKRVGEITRTARDIERDKKGPGMVPVMKPPTM